MESDIRKKGKFAFVIPVYNHEQMVCEVIDNALGYKVPVFVVDDGSTDSTADKIRNIEGINVLTHSVNQGKGAALLTGFEAAGKVADWAITVDADGQHDLGDVPKLVNALTDASRPIVIGLRQGMDGKAVPWTSRFGRQFSNFWVLLSGGTLIQDSQCGFRVYPLPETLNLRTKAKRYQFEVEVLAKAAWKGIPVIEVPVSVDYMPGDGRVSHFRPFIDFLRNSSTFTRLITQRILIPSYFRKK